LETWKRAASFLTRIVLRYDPNNNVKDERKRYDNESIWHVKLHDGELILEGNMHEYSHHWLGFVHKAVPQLESQDMCRLVIFSKVIN
jgi:hypothetical protein